MLVHNQKWQTTGTSTMQDSSKSNTCQQQLSRGRKKKRSAQYARAQQEMATPWKLDDARFIKIQHLPATTITWKEKKTDSAQYARAQQEMATPWKLDDARFIKNQQSRSRLSRARSKRPCILLRQKAAWMGSIAKNQHIAFPRTGSVRQYQQALTPHSMPRHHALILCLPWRYLRRARSQSPRLSLREQAARTGSVAKYQQIAFPRTGSVRQQALTSLSICRPRSLALCLFWRYPSAQQE
mmetsp:Transcript_100417/g.161887  ORF Transcript_100417/g.161887 Transcript_100417/m.161887 type:complete len:240 (-) Transcript_100417:1485-2204(-)